MNNFEGPYIPGPSGSNQNGFVFMLNQQLAGGATYVLPNASIFEARLGVSRIEAGKRPPLTGGPSMRELYGITGLPDDRTVTGGLTTQTVTGFSQLGRQATNPQFQNPFKVNPRFNYTSTLGRHSLKAGYEYLAVNTDVQDTNPLMGLDTYSGQFSRPCWARPAPTTLYNLADFYFGARTQYELANLLVVHMRQRYNFAYIQDDFKFSQKLTLNIGLRYEYATPYLRGDNRLSNYDPATNSIVQAKDGSIYDRALVDPDRNNFAPRIGFAYNIYDKTVAARRLRHRLHPFQPHRQRRRAGDELPANHARQRPQNPSASSAALRGQRLRQLLPPDAIRLPDRVAERRHALHPARSRTGYIQNWQLSVQRELTSNMLFDVAYVGNHAVKLILLADFNQARPFTAAGRESVARARSRRGARSRGFAADLGCAARGLFELPRASGEVRAPVLEGPLRAQLVHLVEGDRQRRAGARRAGRQHRHAAELSDIAGDRGASAYDQPFNNMTSFVWELPFGAGARSGAICHTCSTPLSADGR